jgi:hypothetical protein
MRRLDPRLAWVGIFCLVNLVCGVAIYFTRSLLGEASGTTLLDRGVVPWITLLVIASYVVPLLVIFPLFSKIKIRSVNYSKRNLGDAVGIICLILQLAYIAFFITTGVGVAGSANRTESPFSVFWVLVNVDSLFFVYYGFYRSSRMFWPNLLASTLSNVLRGWNGIFLTILFMESCRLMRSGKLRLKHMLLGATFVVVGYPIIWSLKWQVRAVLSEGVKMSDLGGIVTGVAGSLGASGFFQVVGLTLLGLLARLQLVSDVIVVLQSSHEIAARIAQGFVNPFWREGLLGLTLDRLSGIRTVDLGVALADRLDPFHQNNWNANPGYVGWFFIQPWAIPLYLLYSGFLCWISMYLVKKLAPRQSPMDMLWFAWCGYLIAGWIASFILFSFVLVIFHALHLVASLYYKWKESFAKTGADHG